MNARDGDFREWRRLQALHLREQGWRRCDVADALDVTERSVSNWMAVARVRGPVGLLSAPIPGRPPELSPLQRQLIPEFLWHGAEAYGFRGSVWTCGRIAKVIEEEFGVAYDKGHVSRLLRQLRWLPSVVKTYAPRAHTPVLRAKLTRDHLSVMGGMTPAGRIYTLARQDSLNGSHSVEFLVHLLRVPAERLLVIWDGSPIHRRTLVREFVTGTNGKVRLEALPGYAPDLNPWDEGGWHHLKNVEMRNLICRDAEQLHEEFHFAVHRLRQKTWLVDSFFAQAGLRY